MPSVAKKPSAKAKLAKKSKSLTDGQYQDAFDFATRLGWGSIKVLVRCVGLTREQADAALTRMYKSHHILTRFKIGKSVVRKQPFTNHYADATIVLAPNKPRVHCCPECAVDGWRYPLVFKNSSFEQWGTVVTRYDYYRCPVCKTRVVSTNGRKPELAA